YINYNKPDRIGIAEMTCAGNLMIVALSLNMLKIGKFKVANLLPGLLTAPVLTALFALFG
ncbi:MAG: DUF554 domain-containing protein, partial [Clostridia bacterium]|nr:DUF554 domain-containing protein [Clostridia bacterium]